MPDTTRMRFLGNLRHGQKVVELPVPFLAKSQRKGALTFTPECDVPDEWVEPLLQYGAGGFEKVKQAEEPKPMAAAVSGAETPAPRRGRPFTRKVTHARGHEDEG